ncbi:MAG TPA: hypothetical protein VEK11_06670 [Thermoanaerobaculia bacterium]|nr:hypothetical protein [Thermoanaerobaculia bacterium]
MTRTLRTSALYAILALVAVSTFAQDRPLVGTVIDVDEGRGRLQVELDDASATRVMIETDSVSTTYHNFGTVIAGKPEIFTGSSGLSNIRLGDRIDVRGPVRGEGVYRANRVTLVGRDVPAAPTGVGQTRNPTTSASTPTDDRVTGPTVATSRIEGTVRQINEREGRIVVQTTDRRMITVRTGRTTAVWYRNQQYTIANLEVGDRIRVDYDTRDAAADEIAARRIDVTASVQDTAGTATNSNTVTILEGRVTRIEGDSVFVDDGRGEMRVDMRDAEDNRGEVLRAADLRVGDRVEITGSYNRVGDIFAASTVRFEAGPDAVRDDSGSPIVRFGLVSLTGTFVETLEDASTLGFRDRETNQLVRIWAADDLVVRTKANTYTTAESLRVNDTAVVTAFRDWQGNLVAQTIRLRNR